MNRNIPKQIKDFVYKRQNGKCVCCIEKGEHYHHLYPFCEKQEHHFQNIFLLCERHHKLFHLGDPETFECLFEYAFYVQYGYIPENEDLRDISKKINEILKNN